MIIYKLDSLGKERKINRIKFGMKLVGKIKFHWN